MFGMTVTQCFLYGGILIMLLSLLLGIISLTVLSITGKKLKRELKEAYGEPERYNL